MQIRLGVAVKILGGGGLRPRDGRRSHRPGEPAPHLSISLLLLRDVLLYLGERRIALYRLPDDLAPDLGRGGPEELLRQVEECAALLVEVGALARAQGIRLTMHLGMHVALASPDEAVAGRALAEIAAQARLLEALGAGAEGTLVLHVGGARGGRAAALERFARRVGQLPPRARERLAVEPDEDSFDLADLLWLHQRCGVAVAFDTLHHQLHSRGRIPLPEALGLALGTWPPGVRPKIHVSTQRTEAHLQPARAGEAPRVIPPRHGQHADFVNPFEFARVVEAARGLPPFDAMLEAKAADLALLRLREDLARFAPELTGRVDSHASGTEET
jgi:UV DNA damage endonuclease